MTCKLQEIAGMNLSVSVVLLSLNVDMIRISISTGSIGIVAVRYVFHHAGYLFVLYGQRKDVCL